MNIFCLEKLFVDWSIFYVYFDQGRRSCPGASCTYIIYVFTNSQQKNESVARPVGEVQGSASPLSHLTLWAEKHSITLSILPVNAFPLLWGVPNKTILFETGKEMLCCAM